MKAGNDNCKTGGGAQDGPPRITRTGAEASQGEIILRSRRRRIVFILGLAGLVVVAALTALSGMA